MFSGGGSAAWAALITDLPDMSPLTPFAVFGNKLNLKNVTIGDPAAKGDVGVSKNGTITLDATGTINGDVYLDNPSSSTLNGTYGSLNVDVDLSAAQSLVSSASSTLEGLTADQTYTTWNTTQTIAGNGGVNVLSITGDIGLNNATVTLTGGPNDIFVINLEGKFEVKGAGKIIAGSGMDASRILINVIGTLGGPGGNVVKGENCEVHGTFLVTARQVDIKGSSIFGAIYGGTSEIKLDKAGSTLADINYVAFVPEPATLALLVVGILPILGRRRVG